MPVIYVNMFPGRSEDQKVRLADAIAQAMSEIAGSNKDGVHVIINEVQPTNWYRGGKPLGAMRKSAKADQGE